MPVPDFSPGEVLTAAAMDSIGLWLVKTQTVGTGVSSVTVSGAFSASYENYRVIYEGFTASLNDNAYQISFGPANQHYAQMRYDGWGGLASGNLPTTAQAFGYFGLSSQGTQQSMILDILAPFETRNTKWNGNFTSNGYTGTGGGLYFTNDSISSFTLIAPFGTMTGGTIRIYGYRN
jgi:hypothetical protein